jgi:hypothetical protein
MTMIEVAYSYDVNELGYTTFDVADPSDTDYVDNLTEAYVKKTFEGDLISNIKVESIKVLKETKDNG